MKKIILDTDIGWDCDDAGALALLNAFCAKGEAELLAVTANYADKYVAGCIDAINRYFGRSVPVGVRMSRPAYHADDESASYNGYAKAICQQFPNGYKDGCKLDSVRLLRETLTAADDKSVTLVAIGNLGGIAELLESVGDDISPLSGAELIKAKLERTVIMGGRFKGTWPMIISESGTSEMEAEYNIKGDIRGAKVVCDNWPGELVFSSYEIGNYCITLRNMKYDEAAPNPVALAYKLFPWASAGRQSWDPTAALFAVRPDAGYYYLHPWGRVRVSDEGVTTWEESEKFRHSYLILCRDFGFIEKTIDSIIESELPE